MTFDALGAMRKLREGGAEEPLAEGIVEVVTDATSELLTREYFDQMRVADREYLDAQRVADRESLAQRAARHAVRGRTALLRCTIRGDAGGDVPGAGERGSGSLIGRPAGQ